MPEIVRTRKDGSIDVKRPFEKGNDSRLTHGAYHRRSIDAKAVEVRERILATQPDYVGDQQFEVALDGLAEMEAVAQLAAAHILKVATEQGFEAVPLRLVEKLVACRRLAWTMGESFGLTPQGHANMKLLVAQGESAMQSLAELADEGRAIRERREAAIDATVEDDDED